MDKEKLVIFDMDGVIFDSERAVFSLWKEMADKLGLENIEELYMKTVGVNVNKTRELFLEQYGEDFPFDRLRDELFEEYHRRYDGGRLPVKKGVRELLDALKEDGWRMAMASSTQSDMVRDQLRDAGVLDYYDVVVGGEMVRKSKPDPEIFLEAAKLLGGEPRDIYVIEDSFNGIRAAYAGGFMPLMVPDMLPADDEMRRKALRIFDDLFGAKEFLTGGGE